MAALCTPIVVITTTIPLPLFAQPLCCRRFSGPTVHFVDEEYDTGPILAQRVVPVYPTDTPQQLAARVLVEVRHADTKGQREAEAGQAADSSWEEQHGVCCRGHGRWSGTLGLDPAAAVDKALTACNAKHAAAGMLPLPTFVCCNSLWHWVESSRQCSCKTP